MTDIFGEGGILARIHASFELRDEQARMADFMLETLADRKYGLVERAPAWAKPWPTSFLPCCIAWKTEKNLP